MKQGFKETHTKCIEGKLKEIFIIIDIYAELRRTRLNNRNAFHRHSLYTIGEQDLIITSRVETWRSIYLPLDLNFYVWNVYEVVCTVKPGSDKTCEETKFVN